MTFTRPSLQARALRLLALREHSRRELERKLAPHLSDEDGKHTLTALLDELEAQNLISAARVAQSVARLRGAKLGTARVVQELRHKGLDDDTVRETASQLRATEHARAWQVWSRKFGLPPATTQERQRQMRFLASRGFDSDVVRKVVNGQAPDTDTDIESDA